MVHSIIKEYHCKHFENPKIQKKSIDPSIKRTKWWKSIQMIAAVVYVNKGDAHFPRHQTIATFRGRISSFHKPRISIDTLIAFYKKIVIFTHNSGD